MHFSFSKKWGLLDYKVWLSFIITAFLCLGLLSYKIATKVVCHKVLIEANGRLNHSQESANTYYVNEQITIAATFPDGSKHNIEWDFGDKTELQNGAIVSHVYKKTGNYMITAIVDGACKESINIRVTDGLFGLQGSGAPNISPIVSGDVMNVGDESIFNTTLSATTYTWSVEEMPELGKINTPTAKFIFNKPGNFTVNLLLNDGRTFRKVIQVADPSGQLSSTVPLPPTTNLNPGGPPPPPISEGLPPVKNDEPIKEEVKNEEVPQAPVKTYEQLPLPAIQQMLEDVIEGKKDVADFNNQLCNGAGTKVVANDKPTNFASLCVDLKEKKRKMLVFKKEKSIKSVKVVRDENNGNCISLMYVNYK